MGDEAQRASLPAIMYETGPDEAFLVGTEEELRALATGILERLANGQVAEDYHGVSVRRSAGRLTEAFSDVCVHGVVITETEHDTKKLINGIRVNNAEPPIASPGWPQ